MERIINNKIRKAYMDNLLDTIKKISDLDWQRESWVQNSLPNEVSSWEEIMCEFFDDASIDHFLKNIDPKFGLSDEQIELIVGLRDLMNNYANSTPNTMNPGEVLKDQEWQNISMFAKKVILAFKDYKLPD